MQSVHGTGEPGLDAIKVTNWNLANKAPEGEKRKRCDCKIIRIDGYRKW